MSDAGDRDVGEGRDTAAATPSMQSPDPSAPNSYRFGDTTDRNNEGGQSSHNTTRPSSAAQSRPRSGLASSTAPRPARSSVEDPHAAPSEASRAAAQEAQAAVRKDGGSVTVPAPPIGLHSFGNTPSGAAAAPAGAGNAASAAAPAAGGAAAAPGAPSGLAALNAAAMANMQATLFGMGAAPVTKEVALVTVPRLDDLIIKALADNYHLCPALDWIPAEYLDNVVGLLQPGRLDFISSASLITAEKYWQRLARERWTGESLNLACHGQSWKRLYAEKHLQECLEKYHHSRASLNYTRLLGEVEACKPFVHTLVLAELVSHLDLSDLLFDFPHLQTLRLRYGARRLQMDYDKSLFGMSLSDCVQMGKLMTHTSSITSLSLCENLLGDEAVMLLMGGLHPAANSTLTSLDLSHNKITDIGARRLAQLLDGGMSEATAASALLPPAPDGLAGSVLLSLNLSDNHIGAGGAAAFGAALSNNRGLRKLNLSLNGLGDEGGAALLAGGTQHTALRELVLSSAELGPESGEALLNLVRFNRSLDSLNLACNPDLLAAGSGSGAESGLGLGGGAALLDALRQNEQIWALDMRRNPLAPDVDAEIKALLSKRLALLKQATRKAFQKDWDAAM